MGRRAQMSCDGIPVAKVRGRLAGTLDLEDQEAEASVLDDIGVAVVVFRVNAPTFKVNKDGDLERTNVYGVTDFRIPDAELKEALIERMGLYGADTLFSTTATPPPPVEAPEAEAETEILAPPPPVDPPPPVTEPEVFTPAANGRSGDAPKVAKFSIDDVDDRDDGAVPIDREVVGSIHRSGAGKDPALAGFLSGDD